MAANDDNPERWLDVFRAMGTPDEIRRRAAEIEKLLWERQTQDFKDREAALDVLLDERKGRKWFVDFTRKAALYAAAVVSAFLGSVTVLAWLRDYILSLK